MNTLVGTTLALVFWAIPGSSSIRTIGVRVEGPNAGPRISVFSDIKAETRRRVSIDEAKAVLSSVQWYGSSVLVGIVVSDIVSIHAYRPLLDAFDRHPALELLFIRDETIPAFVHDNARRMVQESK
jgi:hypothetical protein